MRVLLIEDNDDDALIVEKLFAAIATHGGRRGELHRVDLLSAALEHLETHGVDVILVDLSLPDAHGLEVFTAVHAAAADVPCVVLSGLDDELFAAEAVRGGAQDYLVKSELSRTMLAKSLQYAIERNRLVIELRRLIDERTRALAGTSAALVAETAGRERERAHLTEQLHQSQKMEAVGRLAGGIAHDFNNILGAIRGFGGFVKEALDDDHAAHPDVDSLLAAADRAADLVRQLLTFSRKQVSAPRVLDLNRTVSELEFILRRILGSHVELISALAPDLWCVRADPVQIEQILVNLVVNARDAMPRGGRVTLSTANVTLDESEALAHPGLAPGDHVRVRVSDSGSGMTDDVKERLFEPFFTTKEPGKGTGLGLATCYGIVIQARGHIAVHSELGHGATFEVLLPRVHDPLEHPPSTSRGPRR